MRSSFRRRVLCAAILVFGGVALATARTRDPLTVMTESGPVHGATTGGVRRFLGIPYAAAPVGELRWKEPVAPAPWTTTREATVAGAMCPQVLPVVNIETGNEDCLFVNVFVPDKPSRGLAPVMVWIHGGGFTVGSGLDDDPTRLAAKSGLVLVSINYRLGPFGFLAHPALTAETADHAAGNLGIQDQQAALRWVRKNIRAFGGNPKNVTIFGESAGGISVCSHLVSPASKGLFRRAITESGPCLSPVPSRAAAEAQGERFAQTVGCDGAPDVLACLRAVPTHDALVALPPDPTFLFDRSVNWLPTGDDVVLPQDIPGAFESGDFHHVPTIIGVNRDEGRLFVGLAFNVNFAGVVPHPIPPEEWADHVDSYFGANVGAEVKARYPLAAFPDPGAALGQAIGDAVLACPAVNSAPVIARHAPVFLYQFEHEPNPFILTMQDITLGAFHSAELPYVFAGPVQSSGAIVFSPAEQQLSDTIVGAWARFATRGRPSGGGLDWPRLDRRARYLILDTPTAIGTHLNQALCDYWAASGWTLAPTP